jgi:L-fuculose-phosphate aldolase
MTTEVLMHLAIYRRQPLAQAVVHCHSPYGTAFAGMNRVPPREVFPEKEVWVGEVALAPYRQSGTPAVAAVVAPLADKHPAILLANHGVVTWGRSLTEAYFRVEMLEGYLQTIAIARQLGHSLRRLRREQLAPLLELKRRLGIVDPRL